jgi:predicted O-linked N-acetylglucosamine transferase (SPINDLY family)
MGASLLKAVGKSDWIAEDDAGFAAVAAQLAADPGQRAAWRQEARQVLPHSELMDERGFVRCFEDSLLRAWAEVGASVSGVTAG